MISSARRPAACCQIAVRLIPQFWVSDPSAEPYNRLRRTLIIRHPDRTGCAGLTPRVIPTGTAVTRPAAGTSGRYLQEVPVQNTPPMTTPTAVAAPPAGHESNRASHEL